VFCASLADVFDNEVDREWRDDLATLILDTPNLDWLLLTKRIGNAGGMLGEMFLHGPPDTVWLGATIVNQKEADRDIPKLLATPARVRFLSMEPLIGPVNLWLPTRTWETGRGAFGTEKPVLLCNHCCNGDRCDDRTHVDRMHCAHCRGTGRGKPIDWVIVGGESGPKARPMHPDWARSLRDQCAAAGVPYLFKQWGEWLPISQSSEELTSRLYRSNRVAKLHEDQQAIDECYGRRCTVPSEVIHHDGTLHGITEPMAFQQGTAAMQAFRVGKKAAGRLLDGLTHDGFPEVRP
jgi:protein gp37